MRVLSPAMAKAIVARETEQVLLVCLTISHPDIETVRVVNNTESVVRTAGTYQPYPFDAVLPEDTDTAAPHVQLRVDNIDREVTRKLRELSGIPTCTLEVILADTPNTVEIGPFNFSILGIEYDAMTISANLGHEEDFLNQAVPAQSYIPSTSPVLFV